MGSTGQRVTVTPAATEGCRTPSGQPQNSMSQLLALKPGLKEAEASLLQGRRKWKRHQPRASGVIPKLQREGSRWGSDKRDP